MGRGSADKRKIESQEAGAGEGQAGAKRLQGKDSKAVVEQPGESALLVAGRWSMGRA